MLRIYIIGIAILVVAIIANAIVLKIGLISWYDFINLLNNFGFTAFSKLSVYDIIWLFVGYPFVLGLGYWFGNEIFKFLS